MDMTGMVTVTVKAYATLREILGKEYTARMETSGTVSDLLSALCVRFPALSRALFDKTGQVKRYVNIMKNGRNIAFLDGIATALTDGDVLSLFPPAGGG